MWSRCSALGRAFQRAEPAESAEGAESPWLTASVPAARSARGRELRGEGRTAARSRFCSTPAPRAGLCARVCGSPAGRCRGSWLTCYSKSTALETRGQNSGRRYLRSPPCSERFRLPESSRGELPSRKRSCPRERPGECGGGGEVGKGGLGETCPPRPRRDVSAAPCGAASKRSAPRRALRRAVRALAAAQPPLLARCPAELPAPPRPGQHCAGTASPRRALPEVGGGRCLFPPGAWLPGRGGGAQRRPLPLLSARARRKQVGAGERSDSGV